LAGAIAALSVLRLRLEAIFARRPSFTCAFGKAWYTSSMAKVAEKMDVTPVAFTDDLAEMADYVRSPEGRAAIERGLQDIDDGRMFEGKGALASELKRRADERRRA
jgi:predicted transcriptional regulator